MNKLSKRAGVLAGVMGCGAAAVIGLTTSASLASPSRPSAGPVVAVNCGKAEVRPSSFVLACADGGAILNKLHWVSWQSVAFGSGTEVVNSCVPTCVAGKAYSFPVLVTVWGAKARPGHAGQRYFSEMTLIHTGSLHRPKFSLPRTQTFELFPNL
jgi:hypothetical protein